MNFKEFIEAAQCYNCGVKVNNPKPLHLYPDKELITYKCQCSYSFIIPYDKGGILNCFAIYLPINEAVVTPKGIFQIPFITISADSGKETFEVQFHSKEPSLLDNSKYFRCNYIPDFMSLPKEQLIQKLNELLIFI